MSHEKLSVVRGVDEPASDVSRRMGSDLSCGWIYTSSPRSPPRSHLPCGEVDVRLPEDGEQIPPPVIFRRSPPIERSGFMFTFRMVRLPSCLNGSGYCVKREAAHNKEVEKPAASFAESRTRSRRWCRTAGTVMAPLRSSILRVLGSGVDGALGKDQSGQK